MLSSLITFYFSSDACNSWISTLGQLSFIHPITHCCGAHSWWLNCNHCKRPSEAGVRICNNCQVLTGDKSMDYHFCLFWSRTWEANLNHEWHSDIGTNALVITYFQIQFNCSQIQYQNLLFYGSAHYFLLWDKPLEPGRCGTILEPVHFARNSIKDCFISIPYFAQKQYRHFIEL